MKAVNLLPPDLRSAPRRMAKGAGSTASEAPGGSGPFIVLGALVMCVVGLAGYVMANNSIKDREAELARVTVEHTAALRKAAELKPYGDFQDLAARRIQTVQGLASLRFDWERALRDISHATPDNVTLSNLNGSITTGQLGAASSNQLRGAISSPAIELKGCTNGQPAVARLMARLRTVRGVTRVTLSKSDKEATTGTAVAGSGGQSVNPCGPGSPPTFEMVVFFERAIAQAAAAAASATASAPVPAPAAQGQAPAANAAAQTTSGQQPAQPASGQATQPAPTQPASQTTGATTAP